MNKTISWFIYMLRCQDNSLYTGITTDLAKRLDEHNTSRKGAKYTRSRRPVILVYYEQVTSRSQAASREYALKNLRKKQKEDLIYAFSSRVTKNSKNIPMIIGNPPDNAVD